MTLDGSWSKRRAVRLAAVAFAALAAGALLITHASAVTKPRTATRIFSASIEQSAAAVPVGGTIGLTAVIRLPEQASYLQARLQIKQNGGRLVYQRTKTLSQPEAGVHSFAFSRPLEGLGLSPGTHPISLDIVTDISGSQVATQVTADLRVYDPTRPRVPVVLVARIDTRPLTDTSGHFVVDPAVATATRDDVDTLATSVLTDPLARVTLALSPLTLEEWRSITRGYTLASGASVPAGAPATVAYAATLQRLKSALQTGRLELTAAGYSDPSLTDLAANKLGDDVLPQYETGLSAYFTSLETTPSTGTVPAGGTMPQALAKTLHSQGVRYLVVDGSSARIGKKAAPTGAYPVAGAGFTALVPDGPGGRALAAGETSTAIAGTFDRAQSSTPRAPYVVRVELGEGRAAATATVLPALKAFEAAPWARLQLGRETGPAKGAKSVTLASATVASKEKAFWAAVRGGRANAEALISGLGAGNLSAQTAQTQSLISEAHAWSDPANSYATASAGTAFARSAYHAGQAIFSKIDVSAQSVTLAGATGQVPVNIQNSTQETLDVYVVAESDGGVEVTGPTRILTRLPPRETFVQVPVDMHSSLNGRLEIDVVSGPLVISKQTVTVHRSYLDRLALVLGIVVALGGLLVFIVRRVAASPELDEGDSREAANGSERYTEPEPPTDEPGDE